VIWKFECPSALAASVWPKGMAAKPPRTFSAVYAELKIVIPINARINLSIRIPVGRNNGIIKEKRNKMLISGTPRIASMNIVQIMRIMGSEERLPKANITPSGKDITIAPIARSNVTRSPALEYHKAIRG